MWGGFRGLVRGGGCSLFGYYFVNICRENIDFREVY